MQNESLLMMPGPVPMPERVRFAMARQAMNHRGAEFGQVVEETTAMLKEIFCTKNDLLTITGSGTAGMEAAISNFCQDKKIACLVNGKFGDRLYKVSQRYGSPVALTSDWGTPLPLDALERELEEGAEAVTLVHNETSAAILNPASCTEAWCTLHHGRYHLYRRG